MAIHSQNLVKIRQAVWPSIRSTYTHTYTDNQVFPYRYDSIVIRLCRIWGREISIRLERHFDCSTLKGCLSCCILLDVRVRCGPLWPRLYNRHKHVRSELTRVRSKIQFVHSLRGRNKVTAWCDSLIKSPHFGLLIFPREQSNLLPCLTRYLYWVRSNIRIRIYPHPYL